MRSSSPHWGALLTDLTLTYATLTSPSSTAAIVILAALSREPASGRLPRTMVTVKTP